MTAYELRRSFHDDLAELQQRIEGMAAMVIEGIDAVTRALLAGDVDAALRVIGADAAVDRSYSSVQDDVFSLVARQAPVARDLRFLIASLRIAQEIERSGDLVSSVGRRVERLDVGALTPPIRVLLADMGTSAAEMFRAAAAAYAVLDGDAARTVPKRDDVVDDLQVRLLHELFGSTGGPIETVIELGLIARLYERIADHAVVIAERVCFVVGGTPDAGSTVGD